MTRLAIALGDPAGIGAEVVLKAVAELQHHQPSVDLLLVGCRHWLQSSYEQLQPRCNAALANPAELTMLELPLESSVQPGEGSSRSGAAGFAWLTAATQTVLKGDCDALVTAPIAKHWWHQAGHHYPGQTERLAELCGSSDAAMLFTARSPHSGWRFNTLLATTHIPLAEVPKRLSPELLQRRLEQLQQFCQRFQTNPTLHVAGLNPHAGEAGQLGQEEVEWITPLLQRLSREGFNLRGPVPPDTCWMGAAQAWQGTTAEGAERIDGYLALYHDQGLIPVKLLGFDQAVNTTLGLPFLRTSPDHGTGFDRAGEGTARAASMLAAMETALELG